MISPPEFDASDFLQLNSGLAAKKAGELIIDGHIQVAWSVLDQRGEPELIWNALRAADIPVLSPARWGDEPLRQIKELGRQCARLFLPNPFDHDAASSFWSHAHALGVESMEFFQGAIEQAGEPSLRVCLTRQLADGKASLNALLCDSLGLAFEHLPAEFQIACMEADWEGRRGLLAKPEDPEFRHGLLSLSFSASERPLALALDFLQSKPIDLPFQVGARIGRANGIQQNCIQRALEFNALGCARLLLDAAPEKNAAFELSSLYETIDRQYPHGPIRSYRSARLAAAEALDLERSLRPASSGPARSPL